MSSCTTITHCLYFLYFSLYFSTSILFFFFFNDTATTEIYTLSLHDALPIFGVHRAGREPTDEILLGPPAAAGAALGHVVRSEEHTSELQSQFHLVCRLLLEKKKKKLKKHKFKTQ